MPSCLIVASHFPPFQSAGVFRTARIAKYLPEHDWRLEVLTVDQRSYLDGSRVDPESLNGIPNQIRIHRTQARHPFQWIQHAKGWARGGDSQTKQTSSNSSNPKQRNQAEPEGTTQSSSGSITQRAKDAITIPWMTPDRWIGWLPFATYRGKRILAAGGFDVIYSSGPPWTNHLVAERLKRKANIPWVADFRDPWVGNNFRPQRRAATWSGQKHQSLEHRVIESADIVIFNTDRARAEALTRYGHLDENKFRVIPNGFDPADFTTVHGKESDANSATGTNETSGQPLRIVHTGAFYGKRNVDSLLNAVGDLIDSQALSASDLSIELIGGLRPNRRREKEIIEARSISDVVKVLPPIPHHECLQQLLNADVLLLVQTDAPLCVPGKLYEYIAVGKPILTLSGVGSTADLVTQENLGPCVDPDDPERLKACLSDLVRQHQKGELAIPQGSAVDRFNGRSQMRLFDEALRAAIGRQARTQESSAGSHA